MPSALFEIYQKNFDKTLKRLSGMLELYQNQTKEAQSITLKEIELNISELERSISQMELEVILEKIPDNKKKLGKIIDNNKNIVKQYKREIQDLKYKDQSILNKKNLAYIPSNKKNKPTQLNFLKEKNEQENIDIINFNDDEDTALFIDKNNYKKNNSNNYDKYIINDTTNEEMNLQKDESIKRINDHYNDSDKDLISNINNNNIKISSKIKKNEDKDKDLENNKYKLNKDNVIKKIMKIISNVIQFLITIIIAFCKNIVYNGYIKLKNYLNHRYGQQNSRRIRMILFIIGFIVIYSLILYIWNSFKFKSPSNQINPVNLINKNNTVISESKNETNNIKNNITNNIDIINNNNTNFENNTINNFNNITNHSINNNTIDSSNFNNITNHSINNNTIDSSNINNITNNFNNTNNSSNKTFINVTESNNN